MSNGGAVKGSLPSRWRRATRRQGFLAVVIGFLSFWSNCTAASLDGDGAFFDDIDHPRFRRQLDENKIYFYDTSYTTESVDPYSATYSGSTLHGHGLHPASSSARHHSSQKRRRGQQQQQQQDEGSAGNNGDSSASFANGDDPSYEGRLRSTLMANYDRNSYPWETLWARHQETGKDRTGLEVEFNLNFHKVHALNVAESTAHLVVWVQMRWSDPRLTWNPEEFGNVTKTWFWIENGMAGGEVSEIWTPDMYLWNQEESMDRTMANSESRLCLKTVGF
jgi:Neurotransmitter-gated ion-channel ligand binding domain